MVIALVRFGILVGMSQPGLVEIALLVAGVLLVGVAALVVFAILRLTKRKDD